MRLCSANFEFYFLPLSIDIWMYPKIGSQSRTRRVYVRLMRFYWVTGFERGAVCVPSSSSSRKCFACAESIEMIKIKFERNDGRNDWEERMWEMADSPLFIANYVLASRDCAAYKSASETLSAPPKGMNCKKSDLEQTNANANPLNRSIHKWKLIASYSPFFVCTIFHFDSNEITFTAHRSVFCSRNWYY